MSVSTTKIYNRVKSYFARKGVKYSISCYKKAVAALGYTEENLNSDDSDIQDSLIQWLTDNGEKVNTNTLTVRQSQAIEKQNNQITASPNQQLQSTETQTVERTNSTIAKIESYIGQMEEISDQLTQQDLQQIENLFNQYEQAKIEREQFKLEQIAGMLAGYVQRNNQRWNDGIESIFANGAQLMQNLADNRSKKNFGC